MALLDLSLGIGLLYSKGSLIHYEDMNLDQLTWLGALTHAHGINFTSQMGKYRETKGTEISWVMFYTNSIPSHVTTFSEAVIMPFQEPLNGPLFTFIAMLGLLKAIVRVESQCSFKEEKNMEKTITIELALDCSLFSSNKTWRKYFQEKMTRKWVA